MSGDRGPHAHVGKGLLTLAFITATFVALFVGPRAESLTVERTTIFADFRTTAGLRLGSPVQVGGVGIGKVDRIDFARVRYACDPLTEDVGRDGRGRTDNCDQDLFCSPRGFCADLETYAGKGHHDRCDETLECAQDEVCFTSAFRRRETHLMWSGPRGVCARFNVDHTRTRVRFDIPVDSIELIRTDSRAMIASNSVLGDQMVNISSGRGDEVCPTTRPDKPDYDYDTCVRGLRVQTRSSLGEDIDNMRKRVDSFMDKADISILAISNVIDELQSVETMSAIRAIAANLSVISEDVAYGEGLVGALLNSQSYRNDIGLTLHALHNTADGLETASDKANRVGATIDRNIEPLLRDTGATLQGVDQLLLDLDNPANKSLGAKFLRDDTGHISEDLQQVVKNAGELAASASEISRAIDEGDGTLGRLINDDTVARDLTSLLSYLAKHKVGRALALWYLEEQKELIEPDNARTPAAP